MYDTFNISRPEATGSPESKMTKSSTLTKTQRPAKCNRTDPGKRGKGARSGESPKIQLPSNLSGTRLR